MKSALKMPKITFQGFPANGKDAMVVHDWVNPDPSKPLRPWESRMRGRMLIDKWIARGGELRRRESDGYEVTSREYREDMAEVVALQKVRSVKQEDERC